MRFVCMFSYNRVLLCRMVCGTMFRLHRKYIIIVRYLNSSRPYCSLINNAFFLPLGYCFVTTRLAINYIVHYLARVRVRIFAFTNSTHTTLAAYCIPTFSVGYWGIRSPLYGFVVPFLGWVLHKGILISVRYVYRHICHFSGVVYLRKHRFLKTGAENCIKIFFMFFGKST